MAQFQIKLFGPDKQLLGKELLNIDVPTMQISARNLLQMIQKINPKLAQSRLAVNCEFVSENSIINFSDELALIGNVCGG